VTVCGGPGASPTWWARMRRTAAAIVLSVVAACSGGGGANTTVTIGDGAADPVAAIEELRSLLAAGDFGGAGSLAVPGHAVLASLAEGATPAVVAESLENGGGEVAANFWNGFAQGVGDAFAGEMTVEDLGTTSEDGVEFFVVGVTPEGGAQGMMSPVELLLGSSNEDARAILSALQDVVPSLLVAANDESISPDAVQRILQLVELITRVG
jgi:hypothetical protein